MIQVRPAGASTWRRLGTLTTNGWGIFRRTYRSPYTRGFVRAQLLLPSGAKGEVSRPFSLTYVKDRYVNPFGCGGAIRC
ncbi:MAG: hypothetical protein M3377_01595 [Actinomycetota bacterium]|nr:hypothetical protein [Actinomycetota bacterium]